jgi:hypothetical protein
VPSLWDHRTVGDEHFAAVSGWRSEMVSNGLRDIYYGVCADPSVDRDDRVERDGRIAKSGEAEAAGIQILLLEPGMSALILHVEGR